MAISAPIRSFFKGSLILFASAFVGLWAFHLAGSSVGDPATDSRGDGDEDVVEQRQADSSDTAGHADGQGEGSMDSDGKQIDDGATASEGGEGDVKTGLPLAEPMEVLASCPPFPQLPPQVMEPDEPEIVLPEFDPPQVPAPQVTLPEDPLEQVSKGSISKGATNGGRLLRAAVLGVKGAHHRVMPKRASRRYGTAEMVELVEAAAKAVAKAYPGSILGVGNISQQSGGRIRVSVSHQSGRDVDLVFYAKNAQTGAPIAAAPWAAYDANGLSRCRGYQFDTERNWALVEAMLAHPALVQWLFVSNPLRRLLLEYALEKGVEPKILHMAAQTLRQPTGSSPHDDHFHVRISCAPADVMDGCNDFGPRRWWAPFPDESFNRRVAGLSRVIADSSQESKRRMAAVERVHELRAKQAAPALLKVLDEGDLRLAMTALDALAVIKDRQTAPQIARSLTQDHPVEYVAAALTVLKSLANPVVWPSLVPLVGDRRQLTDGDGETTVGDRALQVLARTASPDAVGALADMLDDPQLSPVRSNTLATLQRITNRTTPERKPGETEGQAWLRWFHLNRSLGRTGWLLAGMDAAGYPLVDGLCGVDNIRILIPALADERPHIRENAHDIMRAVVNMDPWRPGDRRLNSRFWRRWWNNVGEKTATYLAEQAKEPSNTQPR